MLIKLLRYNRRQRTSLHEKKENKENKNKAKTKIKDFKNEGYKIHEVAVHL